MSYKNSRTQNNPKRDIRKYSQVQNSMPKLTQNQLTEIVNSGISFEKFKIVFKSLQDFHENISFLMKIVLLV